MLFYVNFLLAAHLTSESLYYNLNYQLRFHKIAAHTRHHVSPPPATVYLRRRPATQLVCLPKPAVTLSIHAPPSATPSPSLGLHPSAYSFVHLSAMYLSSSSPPPLLFPIVRVSVWLPWRISCWWRSATPGMLIKQGF